MTHPQASPRDVRTRLFLAAGLGAVGLLGACGGTWAGMKSDLRYSGERTERVVQRAAGVEDAPRESPRDSPYR